MNARAGTAAFVGGAVLLGGVAWFTSPSPPRFDEFSDQGEPFYPGFEDPLLAASLEVIDYDEASGTVRPFKVEVKDGRWSIPSHNDYPADGEERLATTAAAVIDLTKDIVQSDRLQDHEALGVLDPLDDSSTTLKGIGQRVTLRDASSGVLADFIVGGPVEGKDGFRYMRLPGKKRVYAVKVDIDISTRFADWIETNLLDVQSADVTRITINDYTIDETTGSVDRAGTVKLTREGTSDWTMEDLPEAKEIDTSKVRSMVSALPRIAITGVRPKPAALTSDLRARAGIALDLPTRVSLQGKGFFVASDGRLLSNEGEVTVGTKAGVLYTLRFGEVFYGDGLAVSAGTDEDAATDEGPASSAAGAAENRYLFVTASFDESLLPSRPPAPAEAPEGPPEDAPSPPSGEASADDAPSAADGDRDAYEQQLAAWKEQAEEGRVRADELNGRFAAWYYVISGADFRNVRLGLDDLLKDSGSP